MVKTYVIVNKSKNTVSSASVSINFLSVNCNRKVCLSHNIAMQSNTIQYK